MLRLADEILDYATCSLSINKLLELFADVEHTQTVINKLRQLQTSLVDAETGQRGFALTGEEPFLAPYTDSKP